MSEKPDILELLRYYGNGRIHIRPDSKGWHTVNCPFHGDDTASGRVNIALGAFKCFGCPRSGDSLKLIQDEEGLDFNGAIEWAAHHLGYESQGVREAATPVRYRPSWQEDGD